MLLDHLAGGIVSAFYAVETADYIGTIPNGLAASAVSLVPGM